MKYGRHLREVVQKVREADRAEADLRSIIEARGISRQAALNALRVVMDKRRAGIRR